MKKKIIQYLSILFIFSSCAPICGELPPEWNAKLEDAQKKYSRDLQIENISCEPYYVMAILKTDHVDTAIIRSAHQLLFDPSTPKVGWRLIKVYNSKNEYLFSHYYEGNTFVEDD